MLWRRDVSEAPAPAKRPRYLLLALIALSLIGLELSGEGYQLLRAATDPTFAGAQAAGLDPLVQVAVRTQLEAMGEHKRWLLPLGVAELLLGFVLVVTAIRALFRRTRSLPWCSSRWRTSSPAPWATC